MIKQESNYEGQKDYYLIEENKDQILNDDLDFSIIQKLFSDVVKKYCYLRKLLLKLPQNSRSSFYIDIHKIKFINKLL